MIYQTIKTPYHQVGVIRTFPGDGIEDYEKVFIDPETKEFVFSLIRCIKKDTIESEL